MMTTTQATEISLEHYPAAIRDAATVIANYDSQLIGLEQQAAFIEREADTHVLTATADTKSNEQTRKALKTDWLAANAVYPSIAAQIDSIKGNKSLAKIQLAYLEDGFQVAKLKMQLKIANAIAGNPAAAALLGIAA